MRIPNSTQVTQPWRIHALTPDFDLEDVWTYPGISGGQADFDAYLGMVLSSNPAAEGSLPSRALWKARDLLGQWFGIGEISGPGEPIAGAVAARLPDDLAGSAAGLSFTTLPFISIYRTPSEFAAELANATVHAVMHIGWIERSPGVFGPQLAVYVKPKGRLGRAYMAAIKPFRYLVVYPAMERATTAQWTTFDRC